MLRATTTLGRKRETQPVILGSRTSWTITWDEITATGIAFVLPFLISIAMLMVLKKTVGAIFFGVVAVILSFLVARFLMALRAAAGGRPSYFFDWAIRKGLKGSRRGLVIFPGPVAILSAVTKPRVSVFRSGATKPGQDLAESGALAAAIHPTARYHDARSTPVRCQARTIASSPDLP